MVTESVSFKLGERKDVQILVENTQGKDCYISEASYELCCGSEVEDSGSCTITSVNTYRSIISAMISPQRANATYEFRVTYVIGEEVYIYSCLIRVWGRCDDV